MVVCIRRPALPQRLEGLGVTSDAAFDEDTVGYLAVGRGARHERQNRKCGPRNLSPACPQVRPRTPRRAGRIPPNSAGLL